MSLMRVDIMRILVGTYEFWFISVVNLVTCVVLSGYASGLRTAVVLGIWIAFQSMFFVDAHISSQREFLMGSIVSTGLTIGLIVCILFGIMEDVEQFLHSPRQRIRVEGPRHSAQRVLDKARAPDPKYLPSTVSNARAWEKLDRRAVYHLPLPCLFADSATTYKLVPLVLGDAGQHGSVAAFHCALHRLSEDGADAITSESSQRVS